MAYTSIEQKGRTISIKSIYLKCFFFFSPTGAWAMFLDSDAGPLSVPVTSFAEGPAGGTLLLC